MAQHEKTEEILEELKELILGKCPEDGLYPVSGLKNFSIVRRQGYDYTNHCLEKPAAGLTIQGRKRIMLGQREFEYSPGKVFLNCVDVPSASMVQASPEKPFLSAFFLLDKKLLADIVAEMSNEDFQRNHNHFTSDVACGRPEMLDAFLRAAQLYDRPREARILGPLVMRELHYYLLSGPMGGMLRDLYIKGINDSRILDAISLLKHHLDGPVSIEDLARKVNMSVSSLHRHFKIITGFSPLQYHKRLRLYEAQRLMLADNERADGAAQAVGYESVTQFNREYKRMFGEPPKRDITRRRNVAH